MSLVTTCPACGTSFRVTPEQLSAHRGDVRCGQCQHIFNALRQLEEVAPASGTIPQPAEIELENTPEPTAEILELPDTEPESIPVSTEMPVVADAEAQTEEVLPIGMAVDFELDFDEGVEQGGEPQPKLEPEMEQPEELIVEQAAEPALVVESVVPEAAPVATESPTPKSQSAAQPAAVVPSFMQPEAKRSVPFRVLFPLVLLLLLSAMVQLAYFLRTEISAHYPPARPWLEQACNHLGCTVELPRQADLLSIEDSDLQDDAEHAGVLLLVSALYNHAPYPQAYPLLELTLTDTYDKPVLRRTFTPQEYLPTGTNVKVGIVAGGEIHTRLPLVVAGEKPAGYRLYVRY